jgi:hypothetical protein
MSAAKHRSCSIPGRMTMAHQVSESNLAKQQYITLIVRLMVAVSSSQ